MSNEIMIGGALWLASGFVSYGMSVAFFQNKFVLIARDWRWRMASFYFVFSFLMGPFALFATLIVHRPYQGFMLLPFSDQEWLEKASQQYPQFRHIFIKEIGGAA